MTMELTSYMNLVQLQRNVQALDDKEVIYGLVFEVIKRFEAYLIDLNLLQLEEGKNPEGRILGTYSRSTELEALFGDGPRPIEPKREGEPYNFQWTGGLFDGMILTVENNTATFYSTDSKTPILLEKYGNIFGLSKEHLQEAVSQKIYPAFAQAFRARLFL